jgi:16S rRNA processing protein RimM
VRIGVVGRPHGTDGAFVVAEPTERVQLLDAGRIVTVGGADRTVAWRRGTPAHPLLKLEGSDDRNAAEALRGAAIMVPRAAVGPLGEGEFLVDDLIGCDVLDGTEIVGTVRDVLLLPSADVLEVEREGGEELLVPLISDAIRAVDMERRRVEIHGSFLNAD